MVSGYRALISRYCCMSGVPASGLVVVTALPPRMVARRGRGGGGGGGGRRGGYACALGGGCAAGLGCPARAARRVEGDLVPELNVVLRAVEGVLDEQTAARVVLQVEVGAPAPERRPRPERGVGGVAPHPLGGLDGGGGVALREVELRQEQQRRVCPHGAAVLDDDPLQVGLDGGSVRRDPPSSEEGAGIERVLRRQVRKQAPHQGPRGVGARLRHGERQTPNRVHLAGDLGGQAVGRSGGQQQEQDADRLSAGPPDRPVHAASRSDTAIVNNSSVTIARSSLTVDDLRAWSAASACRRARRSAAGRHSLAHSAQRAASSFQFPRPNGRAARMCRNTTSGSRAAATPRSSSARARAVPINAVPSALTMRTPDMLACSSTGSTSCAAAGASCRSAASTRSGSVAPRRTPTRAATSSRVAARPAVAAASFSSSRARDPRSCPTVSCSRVAASGSSVRPSCPARRAVQRATRSGGSGSTATAVASRARPASGFSPAPCTNTRTVVGLGAETY